MPQIDEDYLAIVKHFLRKEEGWFISPMEIKCANMLTYNFPDSLLCISLATAKKDVQWLDIKLNSQEHIRQSDDHDIFEETYTCDAEALSLFTDKYNKLCKLSITNSDYGSIVDIFKELWDSTIRYIRQ